MAAATVSVVFTDLVGSTELLSRVGEERAEVLRREHFGLLRDAIADHGGREVKNLGDGLMVVFDGVTAALDGAVAMQQAISGRRSDEPMTIRVGLSSGECDLEDGDYFGLPVVEAARLCAKAKWWRDPRDRVRADVGAVAQRRRVGAGRCAGVEGSGRAGRDVSGGVVADRPEHVAAAVAGTARLGGVVVVRGSWG